jgi:formylglycine-generating enzyme required for sulfatase activity
MKTVWSALMAALIICMAIETAGEKPADILARQNAALLRLIGQVHHLNAKQAADLRAVFAQSAYLGQGNPAITHHPVTELQCREKLAAEEMCYEDAAFEKICGARYMAPLYDPASQKPEDARVCIDQFEFPDIPCTYPVVWVRAREAAQICAAMGKRLCDAHEWEGACAGALEAPDYGFERLAGLPPLEAIHRMRSEHNRKYERNPTWSYGPAYQPGVCAAASVKSPPCKGGSWAECGSNTYPCGFFPLCRSSLRVYDLNGNAAEHMNLPLNESQMASRGSQTLGYTEMKGSWFIFDTYRAHPDWCRWRAPFWHGNRVMDPQSHRNYHLGFRCCKDTGRH